MSKTKATLEVCDIIIVLPVVISTFKDRDNKVRSYRVDCLR